MISIVILAAGASRRMGMPKQLLLLGERPLVWWTAYQGCRSAANQVLIVTGAFASEVKHALEGLPVSFVHNPNWAEGQSESVKAGLDALPKQSGAVIFLPADQPFVTAELLNEIIQTYKRGRASIVAPAYNHVRGAPVLFDLKWHSEICSLTGDQGARKLLDEFPGEVEYITVNEEYLLMDADTPDEYMVMQELWARKEDADGDQTQN